MGLRDRADELSERRSTTIIGRLREQLDTDQLEELDDLIWGEPRIGHTVVAAVITEAFGDIVGDLHPKRIEDARRKPRP